MNALHWQELDALLGDPDPELRKSWRLLGADAANRLSWRSEWIRRRVDKIELLDLSTVKIHSSFDLMTPAVPAPVEWIGKLESAITPIAALQLGAARRMTALPLILLRKGPLSSFDLRAQNGDPIPALTRAQNSAVSGGMLLHYVRLAIGRKSWRHDPADDVDATHLQQLVGVLSIIPGLAPAGARAEWRRLRATLAGSALLRQLDEKPALQDWIEVLIDHFVLFACVRRRPGDRIILKLAYDAPAVTHRDWSRWIQDTTTIEVPLTDAALGPSHHVEFSPCDGVVSIGSLVMQGPIDTTDGAGITVAVDGYRQSSVHLVHNSEHMVRAEAKITAQLTVEAPALPRATAWATTTMAGLLISFQLVWFRTGHGTFDRSAGATVLLLAPSVLAGLVVRPGLHPVTDRVGLPSNLAIGLTFLASVIATTALLPHDAGATYPWMVSGALALIGLAMCVLTEAGTRRAEAHARHSMARCAYSGTE